MVGVQLSQQRRRALRLAWWRYRRPALLLGVVLVAAAGYRIAAPGGPQMVPVPVAARDLAAGSVVTAADVRTVSWPVAVTPEGLLPAVAGRQVAGPVRAGEAFTDTRVVGRSMLAGQPAGLVAVAVRLADAAGTSIVRVGDRVDVLATGAGSSSAGYDRSATTAQRVAASALVLSSPGGGSADRTAGTSAGDDGVGLLGGGTGAGVAGADSSGQSPVLVLAVNPLAAAGLAAAQGDRLLSVVLLPDAVGDTRSPYDPATLGAVPAR